MKNLNDSPDESLIDRFSREALERVKVPDVYTHARTHARVSVFWHWALGLEGLGWYRGHRYHHYRTWRRIHDFGGSHGPYATGCPKKFGPRDAFTSRFSARRPLPDLRDLSTSVPRVSLRNRQSFSRSDRLRRLDSPVVVPMSFFVDSNFGPFIPSR